MSYEGIRCNYSAFKNKDGSYTVRMENPGRVPGSKAVYYKIIDSEGKTVRKAKTIGNTGLQAK